MSQLLTTDQAATWRTHPQAIDPLRLWFDAPPVVFAALTNLASGALYPVDSVPVDTVTTGAIADVQPGMLICFGTAAGLSDLGRTIAKGSSGGAVLLFPRSSQGTVDGCVNLSDNIHVTVYDHYPVFAYHPYINPSTGVTYKFSDWDYATYGLHMLPIAILENAGGVPYAHIYADDVDGSDILTLTFDASNSYGPEGASIAAYLWDVVDGTITVGADTDPAITATFPPGRRWISVAVTDDQGQSLTRRLLVVSCKDGTAYAPIQAFVPGPILQRIEGLEWSFQIAQDVPESSYLDGAALCLFGHDEYDDVEDALGGSVVKFAGWHHTEDAGVEAQATYLQRRTTIHCLDTAGRLANLPAFPQIMEASGTPALWEERSNPDVDKYLLYLWLYHSSAPTLANFSRSGLGASYPFQRLGSNGGTLFEQIDGRARAISGRYRLVADAYGRLKIKVDPWLQESGDRTSTFTVSLGEDDWRRAEWTGQRPPRFYWYNGSAIVASASTIASVFNIGPGNAPSQGLQPSDVGEMLVTSQTDCDRVVGQAYQRDNAPQSTFKIDLIHGGDARFEPLDIVQLTMSAETAAQRGLNFTNARCLIQQVETSFEPRTGIVRRSLVLERETIGTPAVPVIPPAVDTGYVDPGAYFPGDYTVFEADPNTVAATHEGGTVVALSDNDLGITINWLNSSPNWTAINGAGYTGSPLAIALDPFSDFLGASQSGALGAWLLTTAGLYYSSNILVASPVWVSKYTPSPAATSGILRPSTNFTGVLYVVWTNGNGANNGFVYGAKLTSYGSSSAWSVTLGSANNGDLTYGMDIDHYGSDEMLVTVRDLAAHNDSTVQRVVGGSVTRLAGTSLANSGGGTNLAFIQKPLFTFGGASNSSTGASEVFVYSGSAIVKKSANGGTSVTDITPGGFSAQVPPTVSSICATDDPNVIAMTEQTGALYISTNAGSAWTLRTTDATGLNRTVGFFPRKVSGNYALYAGGTAKLMYSPDFGVTLFNKTGDWASAIGTIGGFRAAIPLY